MLQIILYSLFVLLVASMPLVIVYRRVKRGHTDVKHSLYANLGLFFVTLAVSAFVFLGQGAAAVSDGSMLSSDGFARGMGYLSAALAVGISGIASGKAVSTSASAAIGALTENEGTFGKALVFVGMAEGIALYGMLVAFIIVTKLG
ncbi:MAG: ATP synthase subunit C [Oscillospiraceae bacterium]